MSFRPFWRHIAAAFFTFLAAATPALAQSTPAAIATTPPEIGTVTTSDRYSEPLARTSRPTFVIDRAHIESEGARTIADAIRNIPGVNLFRYGAFGAQTNYGIRGATSAQTLVLLDGMPLGTGSNGSIDLGTLSTAGVTRIEVVEGSASALYGTSAVGGIINIITGAGRERYLEVSTGSLGDRNISAGARVGNVGFALERHHADNTYSYPTLDGLPAGTRSNADAGLSAGRIFFATSAQARWKVSASIGADTAAVGVPGSLSFGTTPNARQRTSRNDARIEITHSGEHSAFSLAVSGSRQNLAYADPDNGGESDTYDGRINLALRVVAGDAQNTLVTGIDLSRESARLDLGSSGPPPNFSAREAQSAAYAQYSHAFAGGSRISFGLRGEHDAPQGSVLAPSFGGILALGTVRLAANASESYRVPTIIDLYYPGFSNPKLQPEKSRYVDATLLAPLRDGSISFGWFGRNANNLIGLDANFTPQNTQRATIRGFMLSARSAETHKLVGTLGITNLYRASDDATGTRLNFDPVFTATLGLERPIASGATGFGITAHVNGPHSEGGPRRGGETVVDAYVRERLAPQAILSLRARNLGNERYAPIAGYPAPGRTFELELSTR